MSRDDNHSTIRPAIDNFFARFERELHEIEGLLQQQHMAVPSDKEQFFQEIEEKLEFIYTGLDVFLEQEKNNLSRPQRAEIQLFQRGVLNFKLSLGVKKLSELLTLLRRLQEQLVLVLDTKNI